MTERIVKSGAGWRLGWEPQRYGYQGLVAGESWAIELTASELEDFCMLLQQLAGAMASMVEELMPEETITCEAETELVWMEAAGFPEDYALRFILNSGRGFEGEWRGSIVPEIILASHSLKEL